MEYPYEDENMAYDLTTHRYVLKPACVQRELGENLIAALNATGDAEAVSLPERFLARISRTVYLYLYQDAWNPDWLEYLLAKYPPLRETVEQMLLAQTEYTLVNGDISRYSGINLDRNTYIEPERLRGSAKIAPEVEQLAFQTIPGLGYCLKYAGNLPRVPQNVYRSGY